MSRVISEPRLKDVTEEVRATSMITADDVDEVVRLMCESILTLGITLKRKTKARLAELESVIRKA